MFSSCDDYIGCIHSLTKERKIPTTKLGLPNWLRQSCAIGQFAQFIYFGIFFAISKPKLTVAVHSVLDMNQSDDIGLPTLSFSTSKLKMTKM